MLQFIFISIALIAIFFLFLATGRKTSTLIFSLLVSLILGYLSYTGFFQATEIRPPRMLWLLPLVALYVVCIFPSLRLVEAPQKYLLGIHVLRIPVEFGLYKLCLQGAIPKLMTFAGWNLDILFGISAFALLVYALRSGKTINARLFRVWNIVGIIFLLFIVGLAIFSAESPIQLLAFDQPNRALLTFPYILLPGIIVPAVLLAHLAGCFPKEGMTLVLSLKAKEL